MRKKKVLIMGAAGRDFHNFNTVFRSNREYEVVAFTATQIPNIHGRKYPSKLAGKLYPKGISILPEDNLENLIRKFEIALAMAPKLSGSRSPCSSGRSATPRSSMPGFAGGGDWGRIARPAKPRTKAQDR